MYASIAGLKAHMQKLNVIGNNVANLNTAGYKSKRTIFKDSIYTMYASGSNGTNTVAGKNPSQIGYGTLISTIDINMSTGSYNPGNSTDCMLDGDGFFMVGQKDVAGTIDARNPDSFKSLTLTRVGDFSFKADGYLSDGKENAVYGFMCVGLAPDEDGAMQPIISDQLVPIRLPQMELVSVNTGTEDNPVWETQRVIRWPVVATSGDGAGGAGGAGGTTDTDDGVVTGVDLLGDDVNSVAMKNYSEYLEDRSQNNNNNNNGGGDDTEEKRELGFVTLEGINISSTGKITGTVKETKEVITVGYIAVGNVTNPNGLSHDGGHYYNCGDGAGDLTITTLGNVGEDLQTVGGGHLEFVNGSLVDMGDDANPGGDDQTLADILSIKSAIGSAGKTILMGAFLEGSNADLATEISELITTQRGYQANTRIVTVTDSMLEELVNMKR